MQVLGIRDQSCTAGLGIAMPKNCRVFRSAEFFATDHRLVVVTLKLHVKFRKISKCDHNVFYLEKLKESTCAHEYCSDSLKSV